MRVSCRFLSDSIRTCTQLSSWGNPTATVSFRQGDGDISLMDLLLVDSDSPLRVKVVQIIPHGLQACGS